MAVGLLAALLATFALLFGGPSGAAAASPEEDVRLLDRYVDRAYAAAVAQDLGEARRAYAEYDAAWFEIEDGVKERSRAAYHAIEDAMSDVKIALAAEPTDYGKLAAALLELDRQGHLFIAGDGPEADESVGESDDLRSVLPLLARAEAAVQANDAASAALELKGFQSAWPAVEGRVRAKAPAVYANTENDMAEAAARLASSPPNLAEAHRLLASMRQQLEPIAAEEPSYGIFDAAIIMLREGLEALLVIAALLAFLRKAGRSDQQRWIWSGSLAGVATSVGVAFAAQALFSRAGAALGSELIEGVVGLLAAAMLFYVSFWLHQKSQLGAWQRYIQERSSTALARNSVISLAAIAFLAVFREGAETAVFYLGIAPSISLADLLAGIALGVGLLTACGVALLTLGLRLPLRPFFLVSSLLIYYLGFKFVGTGLHALQIAGLLPATPAPLPANDWLGLFPTWQTTLPQLALLLVTLGVGWLTARHGAARRAAAASA